MALASRIAAQHSYRHVRELMYAESPRDLAVQQLLVNRHKWGNSMSLVIAAQRS